MDYGGQIAVGRFLTTTKGEIMLSATREMAEQEAKEKPNPIAYARPIAEIITDLKKPLERRHLKTRKQGGAELTYIEWHTAVKYLDHYAPGWSYAVKSIELVGSLVAV